MSSIVSSTGTSGNLSMASLYMVQGLFSTPVKYFAHLSRTYSVPVISTEEGEGDPEVVGPYIAFKPSLKIFISFQSAKQRPGSL